MSPLQSQPRLALVRECLPTARRVALLRHSANSALNLQVEASRTAASELGFELLVLDFAVAEEIEHAFDAASRQTTDAILPLSDPMALGNAGRIGDLSYLPTPWSRRNWHSVVRRFRKQMRSSRHDPMAVAYLRRHQAG